MHASSVNINIRSLTPLACTRVRHILVELSWRLPKFQPDYHAVKARRAAIDQAKRKGDKATRKKLCVGLARQFIVDWWRIRTERTTAEKLGLQMSWPTAYVLRGKEPAASAPTVLAEWNACIIGQYQYPQPDPIGLS